MKQALVTGASGGLGIELLRLLGSAGWAVVGLHRGDAARGEAARQAWQGEPDALVLQPCDLAQDGALERLWSALAPDYCPDVLIHLAAPPLSVQPLHRTAWEQYQLQLAGVLEPAVRITQPLLRRMIQRGSGRVIAVLSQVVARPARGFASYTAAKSALAGYMKTLALEYADRGITANTVSPGPMDTSQLRELPELLRDQMRDSSPGGWTDPVAVARTIAWLAADAPGAITGCDIPVLAGTSPGTGAMQESK